MILISNLSMKIKKTRRYFINFHRELSLKMERIDEMKQIGRSGPLDHDASQKAIQLVTLLIFKH